MATRPPPSFPDDAGDDPLLPFALAARGGDEGAERELLLRVTPVVLEVVRRARGRGPDESALALDALVNCLRALPGFRGDEPLSRMVARIALERSRRPGLEYALPDETLLALGEARATNRDAGSDSALVASLVEQALQSDAAVMVSHIALRATPGSGRLRRRFWALGVLALLVAGVLGYWAARSARLARHSRLPQPERLGSAVAAALLAPTAQGNGET